MSKHCVGCLARTTAAGPLCRTSQRDNRIAHKRVTAEKLHVGLAGDSWWVWDAKGNVIVIAKTSKLEALLALVRGEDEPEEEDTL